MKTKQRVLLALLAAAVLLGAALWAVTRSNAKAEQAASAAAEGSIPLSSFAAEDLEQIEYTFNGQTYTLQYSGGSWQLAQDPAYHLDESACNTMRTALMALNAKRSLTPQAGEDYGLDSPQLTVTVTAAGQSTTLTFGAENPGTMPSTPSAATKPPASSWIRPGSSAASAPPDSPLRPLRR